MKTHKCIRKRWLHKLWPNAVMACLSVWLAGFSKSEDCFAQSSPGLSLTFSTNMISETAGAAATFATVTRTTDLTSAMTLILTNSDPTEISIPQTLTIPAGSNVVTFPVAVVNDGEIDGSQSATITVSASDLPSASATILVDDDDTGSDLTVGGRLFGTLRPGAYRVTSYLEVEEGRTLAVASGTTLRFEFGTGLGVRGALYAAGEAGAEIQFTTSLEAPTSGSWAGIVITASGMPRTVLDHVEIAYAQIGLSISPSGTFPGVTLSHSVIHHNRTDGILVSAGTGIVIDASEVQVFTNSISQNGGNGITLSSFASGCSGSANSARVLGNDISDNEAAGVLLRPSVSSITGCIPRRSSTVGSEIANNVIRHNNRGIDGFASRPNDGRANYAQLTATFRNNLIVSNRTDGLRLNAVASAGLAPTLINNTIARNMGAGISHGVDIDFGFVLQNNLVVENAVGVAADLPFVPTNGLVNFNNVFSNGTNDWLNYPLEYGTLTDRNRNGTPADMHMNISVQPEFTAPGNFHLTTSSLAVNAGTIIELPTTDFEGQKRLRFSDIGYDEVPQPLLAPVIRMSNEIVQTTLTGELGCEYVIQATSNLTEWLSITNLVLTNSSLRILLSDPQEGQYRFYRVRVLDRGKVSVGLHETKP